MSTRKHLPFAEGEYYHIFNRGVDKRSITSDWKDSERFLDSLRYFNTLKPIGSIYENQFNPRENSKRQELGGRTTKLVDIVAYCLNPNHYHLILTPLADKGIEKFMQRLSGGFTRYFNEKYDRTGVLFQGKFKSSHIDSNEYLLHVVSYVNLNDKVHKLGSPATKLVRSSWLEYVGKVDKMKQICNSNIILKQFNNTKDFKKTSMESLKFILENRYDNQFLAGDLLAEEEYPEMFKKDNKIKL